MTRERWRLHIPRAERPTTGSALFTYIQDALAAGTSISALAKELDVAEGFLRTIQKSDLFRLDVRMKGVTVPRE